MNKKIKAALTAVVMIFLIYTTLYIIIPEQSSLFTLLVQPLSLIFAAAASISAFLVFKILGWNTKEGKVWLLIAIGLLGWLIGDFLWGYSTALEDVLSIANLPNLIYIVAYIPLIIGLLIELRIVKGALQKKDIIKSSILTLIIVLTSVFFVIIPMINSADYGMLNKITVFSYLTGDLIILFITLSLIFVFKGAKISKSWLVVAAAFIVISLSSTSLVYLILNGIYTGIFIKLVSVIWYSSYLILVFGAYYHKLILKGEA